MNNNATWFGECPENWELTRLSTCITETNVKNNPVQTSQVLSLIKDKGVILYDEKGDVGNKSKDDVSEYKLAYPNTLVANSMNVLIGSVGISKYFGCVSPVYYVFKETKIADIRYINYLFNTREFQAELKKYSKGIMDIRLRVSVSDILKRIIPCPKKDEQTKIANFLDSKCSSIDSVISKITEEIEKLEEYKKAVITEAVTKGLNPGVAVKDSRYEYLGKVPVSWSVPRLKTCLSSPLKYGANESGVDFSKDLTRYIRITDIDKNGKLKTENMQSLTDEQAEGYLLEDGDVLFARSGATVGKTFLYKNEYGKSAFAGYLIKAKVNSSLLPEYLYYYTLTNSYESWKNQVFIQATIQNIGADKYNQMPIPQPQKGEQVKIVNYLNSKCGQINKILSLKVNQIKKLEEYKKSLIYECVTGKKEIPVTE